MRFTVINPIIQQANRSICSAPVCIGFRPPDSDPQTKALGVAGWAPDWAGNGRKIVAEAHFQSFILGKKKKKKSVSRII